MLTGNIGEWSEIYTFLRVLADGELFAADANLDKIEDVTYKMGGVIRTLFNYGDVLIQTAAEVTNFDFLAVPYPDKVVKVLQDLRMEEQQEVIEGRVR